MSADGDNINSDDDAANLIGDAILDRVHVGAAFAAAVGPDFVCVVTCCNKIILIDRPEDQNGLTTYALQERRYLVTAAADGRLEIAAQGMFDNDKGSLTEYKHCP